MRAAVAKLAGTQHCRTRERARGSRSLRSTTPRGRAVKDCRWNVWSDYREFLWVGVLPQAQHSRNLSVRPEVAIVIFDSRQPPGSGQRVYISGTAAQLPEADLDRGLALFSRISQAPAGAAWNRSDVEAPARHRLYHATAVQHFVLSRTGERLPVSLQ